MSVCRIDPAISIVAALTIAWWGSPTQAQTFTWNSGTTTTPTDGNGTWSTSGTRWWDGSSNVVWPTGPASTIAWFGNGGLTTTGTVTVSGSVSAGGITFGSTGTNRYLLTGGTIGLTDDALISLSGSATAPVNQYGNLTRFTAINSPLIANNLTVSRQAGETSAVALNLGGTNALTGTLSIGNAVAVSITNAASLGSGDVTVNSGGSLSISASGTFSNNFVLTGTGAAGVNYGALRFAPYTTTVLTGTITFGGGDVGLGNSPSGNTAAYDAGTLGNFTITKSLTGTVGTLYLNPMGAIQLQAKTAFTTTSGTISLQNGVLQLDAGDQTLQAGIILASRAGSVSKVVLGGTANGAMTQTVTVGANSSSFVGGASGTSTLVINSGNLAGTGGSWAVAIGGTAANENNIGLTVDTGGSTLYWTGTGTYTGSTNILTGALALGPGANNANGGTGGRLSPSTAVSVSSGATLWFNNSSGTYGGPVSNAISGAGSVQLASGTLTLSGSNSYSGGTVLQNPATAGTKAGGSGLLVVGSPNALGSSVGPLSLNGTGGVDLGGYSIQQGAVVVTNSSSGVSIGNGTLTASSFAVSNASGTASFTANVISAGGLTKTGAGMLAISGANTLTGTTAINAGTVQLGSATALGGGGDIRFGGGTLQFSGGGTPDVAAQVKNSAVAMSFNTNGQDVTFANSVDSSNTGGLTKSGSGTLTLAGNNSYAGTTTISAGVLRVGGSGTAFGTGTVSLGNVAGATLDINGFNQSIAALTGGGSTGGTININSGTLAVGSANTSTTYSGNLSGTAGTLSKQGIGILALNGTTSTLSGMTLQAGQLSVTPSTGATFALGAISRTAGSTLQLQPGTGTITVDAATNVSGGLIGPWAVTGTGANLTYATHTSGTIVGYTASGTAATAAGLPNNASANFLLSTATGAVPATVSANTIRYTGAAATTTNTSSSFTVNGLMNAGSGVWTINSGTITIGSAGELVVATNDRTVTIRSVIRESGTVAGLTFISQGGGLVLNAGTNSFTGPINVTGGALSLDTSGTYGAVNLENTRTLSATLSGAQRIGSITGVGATFTKAGTGTSSLLEVSSYTGATSIQAGVVEVASLGLIGTAGGLGNPTAGSATISIGSTTTAATLRYVGSGNSTTDRVINMAGTTGGATLDASGGGAITFTSALSATGTGSKTFTLTGTSTAANTFAGTIGDVNFGLSQFTSVTKTGPGRWVLAGTNSYYGSTSIDQGELVLGTSADGNGNGALGSNTSAPITIGSAAGTGTAALLLDAGVEVAYRAFTIPGGPQDTIIGAAAGTGTASFTSANASLVTFGRDFTLQAATGGTLVMNNLWTQASGTSVNVRVGGVSNEGTVVLGQSLPASGLVRIDRGTLRLSTSSTTAGSLAAAAGIVVGPTGSLNAILDVQPLAGAFSVGAAQTLSGSGTLRLDTNTPVSIAGIFSPGNSPGIFTFEGDGSGGTTTLAGTTLMEITGTTAGSGYDQVRFTSGAILNYGSGNLRLDLAGTYADNTTFSLFDFSSTTASGSFTTISGSGSYGLLSFVRGVGGVWTSGTTSQAGQTLEFREATGTLVVVPEPATLALAGIGIALGGWAALRRRK